MIDLNKPLQDLQQIKANQALQQKTLNAIYHPNKKKKNYTFPILAVACVILLFCISQLPKKEVVKPQIMSYVSIDVNPSMTLELDENNCVLEAKAHNEDAKMLLNHLDMQALKIDEALDLLMTSIEFQNYLNDGFLQVSIYSENEMTKTTLESTLQQQLATYLKEEDYSCTCASKNDYQNAMQHHMSFGKYQMIEKIMELDASYQLDDLKNKNMRTLKSIYEDLCNQEEVVPDKNQHQQHKHRH